MYQYYYSIGVRLQEITGLTIKGNGGGVWANPVPFPPCIGALYSSDINYVLLVYTL